MGRSRTEYRDKLIRLADRIEEPQSVAEIIIEKIRGNEEAWLGKKWRYKFQSPPYKLRPELEWEFVEDFLPVQIRIIHHFLDVFSKSHKKTHPYDATLKLKWAKETLERLVTNKEWLKSVGNIVLYTYWADYYSNFIANNCEDDITKIDIILEDFTNITYSPSAPTPIFRKLLYIWGNGNEKWSSFLQWVLGSALTGVKTYSNVFYLFGTPNTRVHLLLEFVARLLGEYAMDVSWEDFQCAHRRNVLKMLLSYKRMLYCANFPDGSIIDISALRVLSQYEIVTFYYGSTPSFTNSETNVFIFSSGFPKIKNDLDAFLARVRPIIISDCFRDSNFSDDSLMKCLRKEKEGIFAWLVEGARNYLMDPELSNGILPFEDFANQMKAQWIEEMKRHYAAQQNKKPLPTRKGQTNTKTRQ